MAKSLGRRGGSPPKPTLIETNPHVALKRIEARYADVEKLTPDVWDNPQFDSAEMAIRSDIEAIFGEDSVENNANWNHQIFHSDNPDIGSIMVDAHDPYYIRIRQDARREGIKRTKVLLENLMRRVRERIDEHTAMAPAAAVRDARVAFGQLNLHPRIRDACIKQFQDGHFREAILNAGIALVEYVKERAKHPVDDKGKPLDGTPLMQKVFAHASPILKVNDLTHPTDQDERQGMQFLFAGATLGLRNPRAHSLDPDTAEHAVETIAFLSFLAKVAQDAKV